MPYHLGIYFSFNYCHAVLIKRLSSGHKLINQMRYACKNQSARKATLSVIRQHTPKHMTVSTAISVHNALIQQQSVDASLSDSEIMQYLHRQSHTPYVDYEIILKSQSEKKIQIVSADKKTVTNCLALFTQAQWSLDILDIDLLALKRGFQHLKTDASKTQFKNLHFLLAYGLAIGSKNQ